jgi:hypothetical protein
MVNLWWDCGDCVVNGWSYFGVENMPRILDLFFGIPILGMGGLRALPIYEAEVLRLVREGF